ncbi:MAG: 1-deoxy-D-xylulose-5-phosphate synthase, partial [Candidatus Omnitrophica bacterium]|nr:1-deoxy-D-xylulose-5-phosphate synthase [Candidatus Omnitrophota bacterium]
MKKLLNGIKSPADLKKLSIGKLPALAEEIRKEILDTVSKQGGHLASSLGAVELTIALHYVFNTPEDIIVWDVGHQAYAHKILTGRKERFKTLRQLGGLSGFPSKNESEYDPFIVGHSSTSISTALGLSVARDIRKQNTKIVVMIGDAALAGGMAFEALNHAGHMSKDLLVILNDNEISISRTIGALSKYLNNILTNPVYNKFRKQMQSIVRAIPLVGKRALEAARRFEEGLKNLIVPGMFFEELGFRYFGPIDGHDIDTIISTLKNITALREPILLHVLTKKGKGYKFAEKRPGLFHSSEPFDIKTGKKMKPRSRACTFTSSLGKKLLELARRDKKIVAITAAMPGGTGLAPFAKEFPDRFFDVGIAEGHAVGFAAGLAKGGLKPVVAVYSTFLQRAYDQVIHDVSLQNLPVLFCLDRAGLVGEDGPTHHGVFDIAYLRHIPNLVIMAPSCIKELETMLEFGVKLGRPAAIRYPKGSAKLEYPLSKIELGRSEVLCEGKEIAILALGSMVSYALEAAEILKKDRVSVEVVNARFVKPLDESLLEDVLSRIKKIVTIEEGVISGGFGSAVAEFIEREKIKDITLEMVGLPDEFVEHG